MLKRKDIRIRDPFILYEQGMYYLYATTGETTLSYYCSSDLENWEMGGVAFEIPKIFWAYKDVWAAEVHKYQQKFYLFVSLRGKNELFGTQIAVADSPKGPFVPLLNRAVTPVEQSCIDGTLFVQQRVPYIIYSHDWSDNYNSDENIYVGKICAAQLSEDLTAIVGEPWVLFSSNEAPLSKAAPHAIVRKGRQSVRYGSDAPFIQRLANGALLLTWSPYLKDTYVVLGAISPNGSLKGPWEHLPVPLYGENGGHAMFFRSAEGTHCMCLHAPEKPLEERAHIFEMGEKDGTLCILKELEI